MNTPTLSHVIAIVVAACVIAPWAHANSATMTYQGALLDSGGDAVPNGVYPITVNIWDTAIGGAVPLWTESHANVQVSGGVFAILLGLTTPFDALFANNTELYIEVLANLGDGEQVFTPRVPISSAPYAFDSMTLEGLTPADIENEIRLGFMGTGEVSTISGGDENVASGVGATVGGGRGNRALADFATIGGGGRHPSNPNLTNAVFDEYGTVAGGRQNVAGSDDGEAFNQSFATVGGGINNRATNSEATVAGGLSNLASGDSSTVSGGTENQATNFAAVVPGGSHNVASGEYSFAAGRNANATANGSFCLGDGSGSNKIANTANQFVAEFANGYALYTNSAASAGVFMDAGANAWSSVSDRDAKQDFEPIDAIEMLDKVAAMPIEAWTYKSQPGVRHIGPVAQDFHEAFGLGASDKRIATIDADGVALAAIQGLHSENATLKARLDAKETRLNELETELNLLRVLVEELLNERD